jgi:ketosteroid isomerase-like protein
MFKRMCLIVIMSMLSPAAFGQAAAPPRDVVVGTETFRQAVLKGDADALAAILAEDFIRSPPSQPDTTKVQYVEDIRSGRQKYLSIELKHEKYRVYGDTVLVNVVQVVRRFQPGPAALPPLARAESPTTRALFVWIKQNGHWMLAAIQGNTAP